MKTIPGYSATATATATATAILAIILATAHCAPSPFHIPSHLRSPHPPKQTGHPHGWITRLDIDKESKAFDAQIQQQQPQSAFSSPWLTLRDIKSKSDIIRSHSLKCCYSIHYKWLRKTFIG